MIRNYFKVAFRNLINHKFYSGINIMGLSIGLSCFILISLYIRNELSYDNFNPNLENIYRMDFSGTISGNEFISALASAPTAKTVVNEYPEVLEATRLRSTGNWLMRRKDQETNFKEEDAIYAESNFFDFFAINVLSGDAKTPFSRPNTLALSQKLAAKIFGKENPIGKIITLDNTSDWEVTAVYDNIPDNSHFNFELILSMESREEAKSTMWMSFNFNTYLRLQEGFDPGTLERKFPALIEKYIGPEIQRFMNQSLDEFYASGNKGLFELTPMKNIHLYSDKLGELEINGDIQYVYVFGAIALFILILACINFMNLSTARSANRSKEVGLRKVMGAHKSHLINQFLLEAMLLSFISILSAFLLSGLLLSYFNKLAAKSFVMMDLVNPFFLIVMLTLVVVVGLLAGSYPSFYLSAFRPIEVLKGRLNLGMKSGGIRSTLVVIQFTVSISMIIGTAIVFDQLNYIQNQKLGYDKDQIVMIHDAWLVGNFKKVEAFKNEVIAESKILRGTIASFLPVGTSSNNNLHFRGSNPQGDKSYVVHDHRVDYDYLQTLGIEVLAGRGFSRELASDSTAIILNEAAVKQFGLENPLGEIIGTFDGPNDNPTVVTYKVIGVVKDFHFDTFKNNIGPLVLKLGRNTGYISFKIQGDDIPGTIKALQSKWEEFAPGQPFQYSFLDQRFDEMYKDEQQVGRIFTVFAFLAIFIACLGLYGLAAFTAEQKTKEIGIRKVLGASVSSIVNLLSKDFIKLVLISFVVAAPLAYWGMRTWLDEFAYRTEMKPLTFIASGGVALVISWLTMSSQSYRAAQMNPARSLRDE